MDPIYDIYFAGEILPGEEPATVRTKLGRLFKADEATLDRLFSGQAQRIKAQCNRETALKYQRAMKQAGAKALIRPVESVAPAPSEKLSAAERIARMAAAPDVGSKAAAPVPNEAPSATPDAFDLAAPGSDVLRPEERASDVTVNIDTSALEVLDSGTNLSAGAAAAPPAPDTSHLSMGEVGESIPGLVSKRAPVSVDISTISLSDPCGDFSDCAPPPAAELTLDLSGLVLAPSGSDLLEDDYKDQRTAVAPSTEHLKLQYE